MANDIDPSEEERYWRENYKSRSYFQRGRDFPFYAAAYRFGWESASRMDYFGRRFEDVEKDLSTNWMRAHGNLRSGWDDVRGATRDAFERVQNRIAAGVTRASEKDESAAAKQNDTQQMIERELRGFRR
jgi:hypothetical protein